MERKPFPNDDGLLPLWKIVLSQKAPAAKPLVLYFAADEEETARQETVKHYPNREIISVGRYIPART